MFSYSEIDINSQAKRVEAAAHLKGEILQFQSLMKVQELKLKKLLESCDHTEVTIQAYDGTEFCSLCKRVVNSVIKPVKPRHPYDRDFGDDE